MQSCKITVERRERQVWWRKLILPHLYMNGALRKVILSRTKNGKETVKNVCRWNWRGLIPSNYPKGKQPLKTSILIFIPMEIFIPLSSKTPNFGLLWSLSVNLRSNWDFHVYCVRPEQIHPKLELDLWIIWENIFRIRSGKIKQNPFLVWAMKFQFKNFVDFIVSEHMRFTLAFSQGNEKFHVLPRLHFKTFSKPNLFVFLPKRIGCGREWFWLGALWHRVGPRDSILRTPSERGKKRTLREGKWFWFDLQASWNLLRIFVIFKQSKWWMAKTRKIDEIIDDKEKTRHNAQN